MSEGGPVHVGIDASDWLNQRGLGRYVRCLTEQLALRPDLQVTLFSPEDLTGKTSCDCRLVTDTRRLPWYSWRLPSLARRHTVDVMFFPTNHAWWFGPAPSVVTIHDLACLHFPDRIFHSRREARYEAMRLRWFVKRAAAVCTDSVATRDDVSRLLGCPSEKITVVPLGVADAFAQPPPASVLDDVLELYALRERDYLLYTGGLDFRKNIPLLLDAFAELVRLGYPHQLILVGEYGSDRRYFPDVDALISEKGLTRRVHRLENVDDRTLNALYRQTKLFVFPSTFEGFGIPPLEAMSAGTPVVCSNATSLPEVVGDAAELFDPDDREAFVAAMRRVLDDRHHAEHLRQKGLLRAAEFSWVRTADQMAQICASIRGNRWKQHA